MGSAGGVRRSAIVYMIRAALARMWDNVLFVIARSSSARIHASYPFQLNGGLRVFLDRRRRRRRGRAVCLRRWSATRCSATSIDHAGPNKWIEIFIVKLIVYG